VRLSPQATGLCIHLVRWDVAVTASWSQVISHAPWPPRYGAGAVAFNGSMYLCGGQTSHTSTFASSSRLLNDVWMSQDGGTWISPPLLRLCRRRSHEERVQPGTWTQLPYPPWYPRSDFQLLAAGSAMWLLGGGVPATNDVWRSSDGRTSHHPLRWVMDTHHTHHAPAHWLESGLGPTFIRCLKAPFILAYTNTLHEDLAAAIFPGCRVLKTS